VSFLHFGVACLFFIISTLLPLHTLGYIHLIVSARKYVKPASKEDISWPHVTVQLPIYNERYVVSRLIRAVCSMDYPRDKLQVIVADDSDDDTSPICAEETRQHQLLGFDITHLRRTRKRDFKAGALQEALTLSKGEFIAIFDADFVPSRDFLKKMIRRFVSPDVGLVQARWGHLNRDYSLLTAAQALSLDFHFRVEQAGRQASGCFINFNGTAGVWRKSCIIDSGGWMPSLAEDLDLSFRAQLRGWKLLYVDDVVAPAELPVQVNAARRQQYRWAFGSIQTAVRYLPDVLRAPVKLVSKIHATIQLTRHVPQLLLLAQILLTPLIIRTGIPSSLTMMVAWLMLFPVLVVSSILVATPFMPEKVKVRDVLPLVLFGTGVSVNNAIAIIHALVKGEMEFARTPKFGIVGRGEEWRMKRYALPFQAYATLDILIGIYALFTALIAFYTEAYAFMPLSILVFSSLMYIGLLTVFHSRPLGNHTRLAPRVEARWLFLGAVLALTALGAATYYTETAYRVDRAIGELVNAMAAPEDGLLPHVDAALALIPGEGNFVWLFPTAATDLSLMRSDLSSLRLRIAETSLVSGDVELIHATSEDLRQALAVVTQQFRDSQPYAWLNIAALVAGGIVLGSVGFVLSSGEVTRRR